MPQRPLRRTLLRGLATAAAASLTLGLAACGGGGSSSSGSNTVTIWTSVDTPVMQGLEKWLNPKAKAEGITVKWQKVTDINQIIMTKLQAGGAPDIAMIPQPGVVQDIVKRHKAFPLDNVVDMNTLKQNMVPGTLDSGTGPDGKLYGLLVSMNIKSLVWYNKPAWKKAGYPIPKSLDELNSLTDKIRSQGKVPWCMGVASSGSDGWPATDWFEDLILRYGGPDTYDKWVQHQIPFTDPVVQQAGNEFAKLMFTNGNVLGGRKAIDSTDFGDAPDPMFDSTPKCWMYKQGSFITAFFPNSTQKNLDKDVGVFAFPPATAGAGNPIEGGGDLATLLNNSSQAQKVMKLMSETQFGSKAAPVSSYISPHTDFPKNLYPNNITRQIAAIAAGGSTFRFDASDQMPGAVGAGSFWKEMTAWIAGQEDLNTALKNIDDSWPAS